MKPIAPSFSFQMDIMSDDSLNKEVPGIHYRNHTGRRLWVIAMVLPGTPIVEGRSLAITVPKGGELVKLPIERYGGIVYFVNKCDEDLLVTVRLTE